MNAIDFTTNFHEATSIYSSKDLYAKKRAKLGEAKRVAIDALYDEFLANIAVPQESVEPVNNDKIYQEILASRNMTVYTSDINSASATGAKKLRVGDVVRRAAINYSSSVSVPRPVEAKVEVKEEVRFPEESMTRLRRHEEEPAYNPPVTPPQPAVTVNEVSSRRLDSYLSSNMDHNLTIDEQRFDKLAKKLSEIETLNRKASDLQDQEESLLAEERAMDSRISEALRKADEDYFSATQSLDEVAQRVSETQERMRRKRELLARLNQTKEV